MAATTDPLLVIHPGVALDAGTTYVVAIRGLVDPGGAAVEPSDAFRAYRDDLTTDIAAIEDRRPAMEAAFDGLAGAGIVRADLQLAWTFTTASAESTTGRMAPHPRRPRSPSSVTRRRRSPSPGRHAGARRRHRLLGRRHVSPCRTSSPATARPATRSTTTPTRRPTPTRCRRSTLTSRRSQAPFLCNVVDGHRVGAEPAHLAQYGHGLLGAHDEIDAGNVVTFSNEHNVVFCATKWAGMSEDDIAQRDRRARRPQLRSRP